MKCNQMFAPQQTDDVSEGDSDEEIQELKQRIRIRRREKMREVNKYENLTTGGNLDHTGDKYDVIR